MENSVISYKKYPNKSLSAYLEIFLLKWWASPPYHLTALPPNWLPNWFPFLYLYLIILKLGKHDIKKSNFRIENEQILSFLWRGCLQSRSKGQQSHSGVAAGASCSEYFGWGDAHFDHVFNFVCFSLLSFDTGGDNEINFIPGTTNPRNGAGRQPVWSPCSFWQRLNVTSLINY